jgi:hypothetical protein
MTPIFAMLNGFEVVAVVVVLFGMIAAGVWLLAKLITKR